MINIQIDIIQPQISQAGIYHALNVLLSEHTPGDFLLGAGEEFGGHHHVLPAREVPERPAQVLLAGAALVTDGGVKKVDAQIQPPTDDRPGVLLVQRPAVLAVFGVAEAHAPHTDA